MNIFRETGLANAGLMKQTLAGSLAAEFIDAPGADKRIVICDIIQVGSGIQNFREGAYNNASLLFQVEDNGNLNFTAPVALQKNKALCIDTGIPGTVFQTMVTYYIEEA